MKIINFRGDLTDNSAKKEALVTVAARALPLQYFLYAVIVLSKWNEMFPGNSYTVIIFFYSENE